MIRKVFKAFYYLLLTVIIFLLLGLAIEANKSQVCSSFSVHVDHSCGNFFVEAGQIKNEVYLKFDTLNGQDLGNINLNKIENLIDRMTYVKKAEVYRTIDGKIKAKVTQRKPLTRVIDRYGHSFYIDTDGRLMPLSSNFTARVIIVTVPNDIRLAPFIDQGGYLNDITGERNKKLLKDVFELAKYIENHRLLSAYIDKIAVTPTGDFELIPKNGSHVVELGSTDRMEQKFYKLLVFYEHGLTKIGWNKYNRINLKYKNQVICANQ